MSGAVCGGCALTVTLLLPFTGLACDLKQAVGLATKSACLVIMLAAMFASRLFCSVLLRSLLLSVLKRLCATILRIMYCTQRGDPSLWNFPSRCTDMLDAPGDDKVSDSHLISHMHICMHAT